jgi:uncharacterized protein YeeX (DUF496 family)
MSTYTNDEQILELENELSMIEAKEEELIAIKNAYERSLNDFQMESSQITARKNEILRKVADAGSKQALQELEVGEQLRREMDAYVDAQIEAIEDVSRSMRNTFDDKRQQLMRERNEAAWE